jgi:sporulation protein YlmC with PRC-barrel domain
MRLSEVLGLRVTTEGGRSLGRVHDVRGALTDDAVQITGLVIGAVGILERLGIGAPQTTHRIRSGDVVPWPSIVRVDRRGVVVEEKTKPL